VLPLSHGNGDPPQRCEGGSPALQVSDCSAALQGHRNDFPPWIWGKSV